jgi:hypothetical protein
MSIEPTSNESQSSDGQIWPVNDPPVVLSAEPRADVSEPEEGVLESVDDPVVTLRKQTS